MRRRESQRPHRAARLPAQNGDICEILVNKSSGRPSLDWLSIVKTSSAKHKIKQWFRKERREENVLAGQEALEQELARAGVRVDTARGELIERIAIRAELRDAGRSCTRRSVSAMLRRKRSPTAFATKSKATTSSISRRSAAKLRRAKACASRRGVRIAGVDDVLVRLSKCCSPVPGDPIIGYVTIGRGVSVHRADCPNVALYERDAGAHSASAVGHRRPISRTPWTIEVEAEDRSQLLTTSWRVFAELKTLVSSVTARVRKDGLAVTSLTVQIRDLDHLHKILIKLEGARRVRRVYRVTKRERAAL